MLSYSLENIIFESISLKTVGNIIKFQLPFYQLQARFACLRCGAGGHKVSARRSLRAPGVTLINYKGDNISKYVWPTVIIDITRKITKFVMVDKLKFVIIKKVTMTS